MSAQTPAITVITGPGCPNCHRTKSILAAKGVAFREIDTEAHPEAADEARAAGFSHLPIVYADGLEPWEGFRPDKLAALFARRIEHTSAA